ncbi:sensor histidine kinase [Streptomyces sp. NPDC007088]|uniref:sensor histidine kinase n=1 Tax=Streptomyces sp. NPDC007088 TaxID=3364773 RepID=UPI0036870353
MTTTGEERRAAGGPWWWTRWRGFVLDVLLAVVSAGECVVEGGAFAERTGLGWWPGAVFGLVTGATLLVRRRWPVAAVLVALAVTPAEMGMVLGFVGLYSLAASELPRRITALLTGMSLAGTLVVMLVRTQQHVESGARVSSVWFAPSMAVLTALGLTAPPVLLGLYVGARRRLMESLRERADSLERELQLLAERAEERAEWARGEERRRIAREMHDVVAHRVSLMVVHAAALQAVAVKDPQKAVRNAALVGDMGRQALTELREMLGVLRSGDGGSGASSGSGASWGSGASSGAGAASDAGASSGAGPARGGPGVRKRERGALPVQAGGPVSRGSGVVDRAAAGVAAGTAGGAAAGDVPAGGAGVEGGAGRGRVSAGVSGAGVAGVSVRAASSVVSGGVEGLLGPVSSGAGVAGVVEEGPSLGELEELVGQSRAAGMAVEFSVEGAPRAYGALVERTAYRVVQEALTNAHKHAAGAATRVRVARREGELAMQVENGVPPAGGVDAGLPSGGNGLVGMRERVLALGGVFVAGATETGGFRVSAVLPAGAGAGAGAGGQ